MFEKCELCEVQMIISKWNDGVFEALFVPLCSLCVLVYAGKGARVGIYDHRD